MADNEDYDYYYIHYDSEDNEVIPEVNYNRSLAVDKYRDELRMANTSDKLRKVQPPTNGRISIDSAKSRFSI